MSAGTLQRARKTPATMSNEMTTGEMPTVTSLVGASAAPSQAPAPKPQSMPSDCSVRKRAGATVRRGDGVLRSDIQLIQRSTANPPSKANTGIQKWTSVKMAFVRFCDLADTLVSRTDSSRQCRKS